MSGEFRFGIEEEYFVNDAAKRDAARARTHEFFAQCRKNFPNDIHREMLEPQVEVAIAPCFDFAEARGDARLAALVARRHGAHAGPLGHGVGHASARDLDPGPRRPPASRATAR